MSFSTFQLSQFKSFYLAIKIISLVTFLIGAVTFIDYKLPSHSTTTDIIDVRILYCESNNPKEYQLITRYGLINLPLEEIRTVQKGMEVEITSSKIFGVVMKYDFFKNEEKLQTIIPDNIFSMDAFFAKFLMLSLFTLLYTNPKYWMIALSMINVVIALIFTGMPKITIVLILISTASIAFIFSLAKANVAKQES